MFPELKRIALKWRLFEVTCGCYHKCAFGENPRDSPAPFQTDQCSGYLGFLSQLFTHGWLTFLGRDPASWTWRRRRFERTAFEPRTLPPFCIFTLLPSLHRGTTSHVSGISCAMITSQLPPLSADRDSSQLGKTLRLITTLSFVNRRALCLSCILIYPWSAFTTDGTQAGSA